MDKDQIKDQWIVVSISGKLCALELAFVQEVLARPALIRPPGTPQTIEGYFDLGGVAVVVISIEPWLGLEKRSWDLYSPILHLRQTNFPLGILVHQALGIFLIPPEQRLLVPAEESFNGMIVGLAQIRDQPFTSEIALLSTDRLLLAREKTILQEYAHRAQSRLLETQGNVT